MPLHQTSLVTRRDDRLGRGTREAGDRLGYRTVIRPLLVDAALARH